VVIDIGTGSGSAVLRRAAREPDTLFVGLDADARAMSDASRRAERPTRKGGRDNVIFVVAAAEELPAQLTGISDESTVILPWGSLLSAVLEPGKAAFEGIAATLRLSGELTVLVSAQPRDRLDDSFELNDQTVGQLAARYENCGLKVVECRDATREDVIRYSSGWGQRLGIPQHRSAWLFRLQVR
jgi:hypothetical protein